MTIEELTTKTKFSKTLDANSGENIHPLLEIIPFAKMGYSIINEWFAINDCIITNMVNSTDGIDYDQLKFSLEASESEKEFTLLNLQWTAPRKHLNLYLEIGDSQSLIKTYSIISPKPYPYADIPIPDINLGENGMLSVSIENVGYGQLSGNDKIIVTGDFVRHIYLEKIEDSGGDNNTGDNFMPLVVKTTNYTITTNGERLLCHPENGNITITLPANPQVGWEVELIHMNYTTFNVLIDLNGNEILGAFFIALTPDNRGGKLFFNFDSWEFYPNPQGLNGTDGNSSFYTTS